FTPNALEICNFTPDYRFLQAISVYAGYGTPHAKLRFVRGPQTRPSIGRFEHAHRVIPAAARLFIGGSAECRRRPLKGKFRSPTRPATSRRPPKTLKMSSSKPGSC